MTAATTTRVATSTQLASASLPASLRVHAREPPVHRRHDTHQGAVPLRLVNLVPEHDQAERDHRTGDALHHPPDEQQCDYSGLCG